MFMFRNRRHALVKRLWKLKKDSESIDEQQKHPTQPRHDQKEKESLAAAALFAKRRDSAAQSLLKRLKESQLEDLIKTVESRGRCDSHCGPCCLLPKGDVRIPGGSPVPPEVLLVQIFRWPEVDHSFELRRLPVCRHDATANTPIVSGRDLRDDSLCCADVSSAGLQSDLYECCNPYHWSRLFKPAGVSPFPPGLLERLGQKSESQTQGCGIHSDVKKEQKAEYDDDNSSRDVSVMSFSVGDSQNGLVDEETGHPSWCKIAYWEELTRVGRQFPVSGKMVDIFADHDLPRGNGLSLSTLFGQNKKPSPSVLKTRRKLGEGILLSRELDEMTGDERHAKVWLYNRSEFPVFINSPTLCPPPLSPGAPPDLHTVHKLLPGYSILLFDCAKSRLCEKWRLATVSGGSRVPDGPYDPYSVRVSFAKGWGSSYSRQCVTKCPCWLEVLLVPPPR